MNPIAALRDLLDLTQGELARRVGVSQPTISAAEQSDGPLPSALALALWDRHRQDFARLGVSFEDLVRCREVGRAA